MNILVYGAGPLGSLFAVRLLEGGHDVSLLARGQRLADLREYGVVLEDAVTGEQSITHVPVVEALDPEDDYELVLIIMRKNHALQILPTLAANQKVPTYLFLMNNAAGPGELAAAVGPERVMLGFPTSGGERDGHVIRIVPPFGGKAWTVPIGEIDGSITARTRRVAHELERMPGYKVEIREDMDAWLKYHVAMLMPGLVPVMYATGADLERLVRTRDALVLGVRGMKEAVHALQQAGVPCSPRGLCVIRHIPEPLLVWGIQKLLQMPGMEAGTVGHAVAGRDEMQHLTDEFRHLVHNAGIETPMIDHLYQYYTSEAPELPDGRSILPLDWSGVYKAALLVTTMVAVCALVRSKRENGDEA